MSQVVRRSVLLNYHQHAKVDTWTVPPKISSSKQQIQNQGLKTKFEEIWLGHPHPAQTQLQWSKQISLDTESTSNNQERKDSSDSLLPMLEENCVLNLEAMMNMDVSNKYQRTNMLSRNLFNDCTDHEKSQVQTTGTNSPFNELTSTVCTDEAWNLLAEFEAISDIDNITLPPLPSLAHYSANDAAIMMQNAADTLKLESVFDSFLDIPQLDELFQLTSPESSSLDSSVLTDGTFQSGFDAENNNTSDLLAHLITDTILSDSELEGLFSNTMLDFNTVLGQSFHVGTDLIDVCEQSMQEVPQVSIAESPKRPLEYRVEEATTSSKKRKTVSSVSSVPSPSPSLSSDCNEEQHSSKYTLMRQKNNEASKKSRHMRKQKHRSMEQEVFHLEEQNKKLRDKAEQLEKTVTTLKTSLMKHILDLKSQK